MKRIIYIFYLLMIVGIVNTNLFGGNDPFEEIVNKEKVSKKEPAFQNLLMGYFIGTGGKITLQVENKSGDNKYMGYLMLNEERMNFSGTVKDDILKGAIKLSDGMERTFTLISKENHLIFQTGSFIDELVVMPYVDFSLKLGGNIKLDMIVIKPGTFIRGYNEVTLTKGFWLGKYEITQAQYEAIMGKNPASSYGVGDNYPVYYVSWNDATNFCGKLTASEKEAGRLPEGYEYTLPTEAQWEYACRAGTTGDYNVDGVALSDLGWYFDNTGGKTHPVGQKKSNAWRLYDMHGNVMEWCLDWYEYNHPTLAVMDPMGPVTGSDRVLRGGYYYNTARSCRSACRRSGNPSYYFNNVGFRLALVPAK